MHENTGWLSASDLSELGSTPRATLPAGFSRAEDAGPDLRPEQAAERGVQGGAATWGPVEVSSAGLHGVGGERGGGREG